MISYAEYLSFNRKIIGEKLSFWNVFRALRLFGVSVWIVASSIADNPAGVYFGSFLILLSGAYSWFFCFQKKVTIENAKLLLLPVALWLLVNFAFVLIAPDLDSALRSYKKDMVLPALLLIAIIPWLDELTIFRVDRQYLISVFYLGLSIACLICITLRSFIIFGLETDRSVLPYYIGEGDLSNYMVIAFPLLLYSIEFGEKRFKFLKLFLVFVCCLTFFLDNSYAGISIASGQLIFLLLLRIDLIKRRFVAFPNVYFVCLLMPLAIVHVFSYAILYYSDLLAHLTGPSIRLDIFSRYKDIFFDNFIFGCGFDYRVIEQCSIEYPGLPEQYTHAHNLFIDSILRSGIFGGISLFFLLAFLGYYFSKNMKKEAVTYLMLIFFSFIMKNTTDDYLTRSNTFMFFMAMFILKAFDRSKSHLHGFKI